MKREIPYLSLTEMTNEYMLATFNDNRKYFINYLSHARWVWKKLFWNTIFAVKHKYVEVDTSTTPHSIKEPRDMVRFIHLSQEDNCDTIRPLSFKDNMNVTPKTSAECCPRCGSDNYLDQCVSNITVATSEIIIDDVAYTEKIWKKSCSNGDIVEIREVPTKQYPDNNPENFEIVTLKTEKYLCKLDKKPCGCIDDTPKNRELIVTHCGCFTASCTKNLCDPMFSQPYTRFGVIKREAGRIYVAGNPNKKYLLSYQTNGECGDDEIMVPETAVDVMTFGINARAKALAPNVDRFERRESERMYNAKVQEYEEFLNPILVNEFMNAQMNFPKWGSSSNYYDNHRSAELNNDLY